jgi:hypothetical protein
MTVQSNWRNCQKCQAMFFNGFPKKGVCPAGGQHDAAQSFDFLLPRDEPGTNQSQPEWRNCKKCQAIFFNGFPKKGVCPAGGQHDAALGFNFVLPHDVPPHDVPGTTDAQPNWRNCQKCQSMFFNGFPKKGVCPAGGQHDAARSFNFILPRVAGNLEHDTQGNPVHQ